ncbi:hypothetical protein BJ878DRAFT_508160 [Calycina marina]|uniref:TPR repeat-containing protein n=1 Tax=Calycina marina TaxID=1763456 RepID=A0A9P8CG33_9HELO|nr:hypothetical protein BJ878DRAFT_508160 [Calycina marina]
MSQTRIITDGVSLDLLLFDLESLKKRSEVSEIIASYLNGDYKAILQNETSQALYQELVGIRGKEDNLISTQASGDVDAILVFTSGLAAFNAFLQANVTGPPLDFRGIFKSEVSDAVFRSKCLKSLDLDGVSPYQYIPYVELFCLARLVFTVYFPSIVCSETRDCKWMRIRVNSYHQRLLTGLSGGRLSDSTVLQDVIEQDLKDLEAEILGSESKYPTEAKVQFLLEKAQIYIMQGLDLKAESNVKLAMKTSGFSYALSGALGKRTKFQQTDISQLVVFAKSKESEDQDGVLSNVQKPVENGTGAKEKESIGGQHNGPTDLNLDDDTLLENIAFTKQDPGNMDISGLSVELNGMQPDNQPQLKPLDQILLLTEATLKDTLSPLDKLSREEILPFAIRVLSDKATNWQIYTQALLIRSRIEAHRSRTQERSVLQLQVIVDQIIANTQEAASLSPDGIPEIQITHFLPREKASESAPVYERLKYIYQLNTPTRWEIETELAFAWSGVGSLVNALEIFKRLRLWAEVALCYHSVGQEDKARQVVRRQLFYSSKGPGMDAYDIDAAEVAAEKWNGEVRSPPPAHSPRLWCIIGDLDQDPTCWERAWEISNNRFSRAQRTLGEYYTKKGDLESARAAYIKATVVNRQNNDTWTRLGEIDLRVGNWDGAIIAFQQSIMIDETDAKTYSNLGSALLSKYQETIALKKVAAHVEATNAEEDRDSSLQPTTEQSPRDILRQSLVAYKRGASLAHDNWKIWDNVVTVAGRMTPPSFPELLMGTRNVIRIRAPANGEFAIDIDIIRALILEITSRERPTGEVIDGIYMPPRGSLERATIQMVDEYIVPLITKRAILWTLIEKLKLYQRDYAGALACAEKAWRLASLGEAWLQEVEDWKVVVAATDNLASAYENYGPMEKKDGTEIEKSWKMKARSAVRGIMGKAKDVWEDTDDYEVLKEKLQELKSL